MMLSCPSSNVLTDRQTSNCNIWTNLIANIYFPHSSTIVFWSRNRPVSPDALLDFFRKRKGKVGRSIESNWIENCTFNIFTYLSEIPIHGIELHAQYWLLKITLSLLILFENLFFLFFCEFYETCLRLCFRFLNSVYYVLSSWIDYFWHYTVKLTCFLKVQFRTWTFWIMTTKHYYIFQSKPNFTGISAMKSSLNLLNSLSFMMMS